jgi:thiol-disulfide isomerase/thioredoxin
MSRLAALAITGLLLVPFAASAPAANVKTLELGSPAPDFKLPGVDGKTYTLANFKDAKLLLVLFTCNHCPTAQAYEARIKQIQADYENKGLALVAINPNDPGSVRLDELGYTDLSDSFEEMKIRAKDAGFTFPYLYDGETQQTGIAYGVQATPHAFLFDAARKLRYVGRIDDSEVKTVKSHDLRNAIDALLAGKEVAVPKTNVFGCSTKWKEKATTLKEEQDQIAAIPVKLDTIEAAGVKALAANAAGPDAPRVRVINVWATWCGPCVQELPEFVAMQRMYGKRGFELVTISIDDVAQKPAAMKMLKEKHLGGAKNYIWSSDDKDALVAALDKTWEGPVPFTLIVGKDGKVIYRNTGAVDPLEVKRKIVEVIGRTYAGEK